MAKKSKNVIMDVVAYPDHHQNLAHSELGQV